MLELTSHMLPTRQGSGDMGDFKRCQWGCRGARLCSALPRTLMLKALETQLGG